MSIPIPKLESHAGLIENEVRRYVSVRQKAGDINIYSAYLLWHEGYRFGRDYYLKPAYHGIVSISTLLGYYYDYLTASVLECTGEAEETAAWFMEGIPLLTERRKHFLVDRLAQGRALLEDREFYKVLAGLRDCEDFDNGPFPDEVFPYEAPAEMERLQPGSQAAFRAPRDLDPDSSEFYVQLKIHYEG